ncbi:MAG TPA: IPT/TIG domain-containing protein, partial [Acidiferrobacterales bacterium]
MRPGGTRRAGKVCSGAIGFLIHRYRWRFTPPGRTRGWWAAWLPALAIVLGAALAFPPPAWADVSYTYDDLGRIKTVRSASGEVAEYVYDAVGNILQIRRVGAGQLAVTGFTPTSGPVGTSVTLNGSGFSATAANNAVKFNGVAATVTYATANRLVATVPAGATTGPVSVTVGTSTATSIDAFAVVSAAGRLPPTIADFTPKIGPKNTVVAVTGTNFDTGAGATRALLNGTPAKTVVASSTSLSLTVPDKTGSGRIQVLTAGGMAMSAADFIVPPPSVPQSYIVDTKRATGGAVTTVTIGTQFRYGLILFDGNQGALFDLNLVNFTVNPSTASLNYSVYGPDNVRLATGTVSATNRTIHLSPLPKTGTYTVSFYSGAATATIGLQQVWTTGVGVNSARTVTTTFAGQSMRVSYFGSAGDSLGLEIAGLSTTPAGQSVAVSMFKPDGTSFGAVTTAAVGDFVQLPVLPVNGQYTIVAKPAGTATTSLKLTLERGITLAVNGGPVIAPIATAGESARYVYTAPVNLPVQVNITGLQLSGGANATVAVYRPDGTALIAASTCVAPGCAIIVPGQPSAGPFSIVVRPAGGATGTVFAAVAASDSVGSFDSNNPITAVVEPGKSAYFTFPATAGESPGLYLQFSPNSGYNPVASTTPRYIKIYKPDGTLLLDGPI